MAISARKRILVVDDEKDIVEIVRVVLRSKGHDVVPCYSGQEGLDALQTERPDMIITDLKMPGMSGMEFIKRIRANPETSNLPILVISSLGSQVEKPDAFWAMGLGSDDFLSKPFDPLGLLGRVEYLLRKDTYKSEQQYTSAMAGGATASEAAAGGVTSGPASTSKWRESLKSDDPAEVVRAFVMSWNDLDFVTEYEALSEEMLYGMSMNDWVGRRTQSYHEEGGTSRHNVVDVEVLKSSDLVATVACLRDDVLRNVSQRKDERYTLKKTPNGWKIVNVRSRDLAMV